MKKVSWLLCLLLFSALACAPPGVRVERVIDGDTIVIQGGERVRYIGIDTPELDEPWGPEAKAANARLVMGKDVRLKRDVSDRDRYGRLLRYVYVNGVLVEGELVRLGLARARAYPPDTKYQGRLEALEKEAQRVGRGMWQGKGEQPSFFPFFVLKQALQKVFIPSFPVLILASLSRI